MRKIRVQEEPYFQNNPPKASSETPNLKRKEKWEGSGTVSATYLELALFSRHKTTKSSGGATIASANPYRSVVFTKPYFLSNYMNLRQKCIFLRVSEDFAFMYEEQKAALRQ